MFGDSHARNFRRSLPVNSFRASSARGLSNIKSKTGVGQKIRECLKSVDIETNVIFYFGKVDLDFISNYKYNSHDLNLDELSEYLAETVEIYINYIKSTMVKNVMVFEPPVIHLNEPDMLKTLQIDSHRMNASHHLSDKDSEDMQPVNIHEKMIPRGDHITLYNMFNTKLKSLCTSNNFAFVEINKYFKQSPGCNIESSYVVPSKYIQGHLDHHLHSDSNELYLKSMNSLGYTIE